MSIHYNHLLIGKEGRYNAYELEKEKVFSGSTLHSIYHDLPIRTDTLLKILEYADCELEDFLLPENPAKRPDHFRIDLKELESRGIISDLARRHYRRNCPMSLSTIDAIASFYGLDACDLLKTETAFIRDNSGHLKKQRKMVYLKER